MQPRSGCKTRLIEPSTEAMSSFGHCGSMIGAASRNHLSPVQRVLGALVAGLTRPGSEIPGWQGAIPRLTPRTLETKARPAPPLVIRAIEEAIAGVTATRAA